MRRLGTRLLSLMQKLPHHMMVTISLSPLLSLGEYIALYQMQREALQVKFQEKDRFIQEIMAEKTITQVDPIWPLRRHTISCIMLTFHRLNCRSYKHL